MDEDQGSSLIVAVVTLALIAIGWTASSSYERLIQDLVAEHCPSPAKLIELVKFDIITQEQAEACLAPAPRER